MCCGCVDRCEGLEGLVEGGWYRLCVGGGDEVMGLVRFSCYGGVKEVKMGKNHWEKIDVPAVLGTA